MQGTYKVWVFSNSREAELALMTSGPGIQKGIEVWGICKSIAGRSSPTCVSVSGLEGAGPRLRKSSVADPSLCTVTDKDSRRDLEGTKRCFVEISC
jgi:hypothetical protein